MVEPEHQPHDEPHLPAPTLWPIGFAIGIVVALVGLIVNPTLITPIGAVIAIVFGYLWARDATAEMRGEDVHVEPEQRDLQDAGAGQTALAADEPAAVPRSGFLAGATLGLGALIGGLITLPIAGFTILPGFIRQKHTKVDLGPISNFEENQWYITTFVRDPEQGAVSRTTAFIRNNGTTTDPTTNKLVPSFSIISNHCAHLGCPVQANGPEGKYIGKPVIHDHTLNGPITMDPVIPAGYGCPCHGGQYDNEGNRTAGPPTHALDRYDFAIVKGRLVLLGPYSVSHVVGTGATAQIYKYKAAGPGEHIDGPEQLLYPIQPPHN